MAQGLKIPTLSFHLGPAAEATAHDFRHSHEVIGMAGSNRAALNLVFAVVLLCRQPINEDHLGGHRIAALDVADVEALDTPWGMGEVQQLGQVLGG